MATAADGPMAVSNQGRVLLAAEPADGVLVVHPLATLDAMIADLRDHMKTGEAA